jgi:hypothetical protein
VDAQAGILKDTLEKWTEESKRKWALQILPQDVGSAHLEAQEAH